MFEKTDAAERFLILVNVRNASSTINVPEEWVGTSTEDEITGKNIKLDAQLTLEPFQYLILEK